MRIPHIFYIVWFLFIFYSFAKQVGKSVKTKEADYALEDVHNMVQVIPEIWISGAKDEQRKISRTRSEIDSALKTTPVGA